MSRLQPGYRLVPLVEDFGVPISRIPETIAEIQRIGRKHWLSGGYIRSHWGREPPRYIHHEPYRARTMGKGEGNRPGINRDDASLRGHGIGGARRGNGQVPVHRYQLGEALQVMKDIKRTLDPNNILNPGKMGFEGAIKDILDENAFTRYLSEPEKIEHFPEDVDNEIIACIQCGFCRAGCPTFGETTSRIIERERPCHLVYNMLIGNLQPRVAILPNVFTNACSASIAKRYVPRR